jgi:hypothetical protein
MSHIISIKNAKGEDIKIPFDLLQKDLLKESHAFNTEDELHDWLDKQSVDGQPLWEYLLQNHPKELNNSKGSGSVVALQPLREHIFLQIIQRHPFEILEKAGAYTKEIAGSVKGVLDVELMESFSKKDSKNFDKMFERLNDSNAKLFEQSIESFCQLPIDASFGEGFLSILQMSKLSFERKEKVLKLVSNMNVRDDSRGEKKAKLLQNIENFRYSEILPKNPAMILEEALDNIKSRDKTTKLSQMWNVIHAPETQPNSMWQSVEDSGFEPKALEKLLHTKLLARAFEKAKQSPDDIKKKALETEDFQEAVKLYAAAKEMNKPKTLKKKIISWINKTINHSEYKKAKSFVEQSKVTLQLQSRNQSL